jgi:hypothetical protein
VKRVLILTDLSPASREAVKIAASELGLDPQSCTLGSILDVAVGESSLLIRVDHVIREQTRKLCKSLGFGCTFVASWPEMQRAIRRGEFERVVLTPTNGGSATSGRRTTIPEHFIQDWGVPVQSIETT